jgi:hypothetical protein
MKQERYRAKTNREKEQDLLQNIKKLGVAIKQENTGEIITKLSILCIGTSFDAPLLLKTMTELRIIIVPHVPIKCRSLKEYLKLPCTFFDYDNPENIMSISEYYNMVPNKINNLDKMVNTAIESISLFQSGKYDYPKGAISIEVVIKTLRDKETVHSDEYFTKESLVLTKIDHKILILDIAKIIHGAAEKFIGMFVDKRKD